jgi:hypothetical protein
MDQAPPREEKIGRRHVLTSARRRWWNAASRTPERPPAFTIPQPLVRRAKPELNHGGRMLPSTADKSGRHEGTTRMSYHSSAQIKALSNLIADIHIRDDEAANGPRAIGEILRPFLLELRRSRATGKPMRQDVLDRFCAPAPSTAHV